MKITRGSDELAVHGGTGRKGQAAFSSRLGSPVCLTLTALTQVEAAHRSGDGTDLILPQFGKNRQRDRLSGSPL